MRALLRWLATYIGPTELMAMLGLALLSVGFYHYWRPGAVIVPGAVLLTWSVSAAWLSAILRRAGR